MNYIKNNKVLLLVITVLLLTNISLLYFHVGRRYLPHRSIKEQIMMKLEKEVGLNKHQLAMHDSLHTKHMEFMKPLFEELKTAKDSFFRLTYQPQVSDSVLQYYASKINEKQQAIDIKMLKYFWSIRDLCTAEQKPKMDSFLQTITRRMSGSSHRSPDRDKK